MKFSIALSKRAEIFIIHWNKNDDAQDKYANGQSTNNQEDYFQESTGYYRETIPVLDLETSKEDVLEYFIKDALYSVSPTDTIDRNSCDFDMEDRETTVQLANDSTLYLVTVGDSNVNHFVVIGQDEDTEEYQVLDIVQTENEPFVPIATLAIRSALDQRTNTNKRPNWVYPFLETFGITKNDIPKIEEDTPKRIAIVPEIIEETTQEKAGQLIPFPKKLEIKFPPY